MSALFALLRQGQELEDFLDCGELKESLGSGELKESLGSERSVRAAAEQHRLITAERVLLEKTLHGSIKALTDVLALANPAGFGRATRVKQTVEALGARLEAPDRWQVEVAAMLSQIGCVTLPPELAEKLYHGKALTSAEQTMGARLPAVTDQLLSHIPRLDTVRLILRYQETHFDGEGAPPDRAPGEQIPLGARLLKIALDFDILEAQGTEPGPALDCLRDRTGWYDPDVLDAFVALRDDLPSGAEVRENLGGVGAGEDPGQVEDPHTV